MRRLFLVLLLAGCDQPQPTAPINQAQALVAAVRAVDSQQTLVLVPATSTVSMSMPRSTRSSDDEPWISAL